MVIHGKLFTDTVSELLTLVQKANALMAIAQKPLIVPIFMI